MKLLDKIKNAIFEEEEFDEEFTNDVSVKEEKKSDDIVKKIDIEKTIPKRIEIEKAVEKENNIKESVPKQPMKRELRRTPVIFDEEDFIMDDVKPKTKPKPEIRKEEPKKSLYGGYRDEKAKEKFRPSPVISPVYGFVGVSPILEKSRDDSGEKHFFVQDRKPEISLDAIRQKAFGDNNQIEEDDDLGLLYEMKKDEVAPAVSKITLGDAEEYFEDLGLEYNVDYKDEAKEKKAKEDVSIESKESIEQTGEFDFEEIIEGPVKVTRSKKNKELSEQLEDEIKKEKELESTRELEITREQLKPKTAKEIKKVKKIEDANLGMNSEKEEIEEVDEKNLYDLIDMMYDSK